MVSSVRLIMDVSVRYGSRRWRGGHDISHSTLLPGKGGNDMKLCILSRLLLVSAVVIALIAPACIFSPDKEPEPVNQPTGPPYPPPPPPPPPPDVDGPEPILPPAEQSLERIAGDVLRGCYGLELQRLLADEISLCLNEMSTASMVSISLSSNETSLELLECSSSEIFYDDGYLASWILNGEYGEVARTNLHLFIRSFENRLLVP